MLTGYSCDPEHGDTPHGARIEQCRIWRRDGEGSQETFAK